MVERTQVQRVESVLKQIKELKEEDEEIAKATGKNFNVFSVLGVERKEVRHSAFLKDLLDPKGTHSQGAVFLEHFLKLPLLLEKLPDSFRENFEEFQVESEALRGDGFIDILLEKDDACIIIENKIDAGDGEEQLNKYCKGAKEKGFEDEQIKLIYLTPNGKKPREESLAGQEPLDPDSVICMSYESHITKWLEGCLKEVVGIARLYDILLQYQEMSKKLLKQPKKLTMKISDILIREYDLITELENSVTETKKRIQDQFFEKLKKITEVCGIEKWSSVPGGISAKVPKFDLDLPFTMELRVEIETGGKEKGNIWYGFMILEEGQKVSKGDEGSFKKYLDLASGEFAPSILYALRYKYLKYLNQPISFSDFGAEQMRYVVEDDELEKLVETIAQEIKGEVDQFIKAKEEAGL